MGRVRGNNLFVLLIFVFLTLFVFRNYFFKNQIPFPANLLVSFYAPWKYYEWKGYPNGPPNKPIGFDVLKLFYPFRKFTTEQLKNSQLPLWNPYNFSGNVHLATYQSAVFYPLNFLYFLLPLIDAWSMLVIIQPILAGFFTYLFLKELNLSKRACLFGAVVFAFSGWMTAWSEESLVIEHSALWFPLILYSTEKIFQKKKWGALLLIFALTSSIFAGFLQMSIYVLITALAWVVFRYCQNTTIVAKQQYKDFRILIYFALSFLLTLFITAVHWLPALEAYFYSPRGVVGARFLFKSYLMPPWHLITLLAPDFWGNPGAYNYFGHGFYHEKVIFMGIPALLFVLYGGLSSLKSSTKDSSLRFFKWLSLITLALGFFPLGWILYFSHLPLFSTMIPSRIFFLSSFGLSVVSAYGMDYFLKQKADKKAWKNGFLLISTAFFILWLFVFWEKLIDPLGNYAKVSFRNLILPTGFFVISTFLVGLSLLPSKLKHYIFREASYVGLLGLSLLSSFYFANKFLYFSERKFVFPEVPVISKVKEISGIDRIWGYGNAYMEKNMNIYYGLYSPEGYDALYSQRYGELMHTQETDGRITDQILRTDANIKQASERESVLDNWQRRRLFSLLGVKYIMESKVGDNKDWSTTEKRFPEEDFFLAWEDEKFRIWEYKEALPRAFMFYDYVVEKDRQKIVDLIFNHDFSLQEKLILEELVPIIRRSSIKSNGRYKKLNTVGIIKYEPNEVLVNVESERDGLLFLSDNYYPGWKAYVDSKETKIYRANYSFRAVAIPAGNSTIRFSYEPASFYWGRRIFVISLILLILGYFVFNKKYVTT